jgi:hypothetical protein
MEENKLNNSTKIKLNRNTNFIKKIIFTLSLYIFILIQSLSNTITMINCFKDKNEEKKGSEDVLNINQKKLNIVRKKYDRFYVMIYIPGDDYNIKKAQYQYESLISRVSEKPIRFFTMNYLENKEYVRGLNIKYLPQIILFDKSIPEKMIYIDQRLQYNHLLRFSDKVRGIFDPVMITDYFQVNDGLKKSKKMLILFNPKIDELKDDENNEGLFAFFMRYSVIAGYDYFHLCKDNSFFNKLITERIDKNIKFSEDTFHFLTGFIKNDTTKILFNEPLLKNNEYAQEFIREFNHFSLNIKDFMNSKFKESTFLDLILFKKSNIYGSFGETELNTIENFGKPTAIIVCEKDTLNKDKDFHKEMYKWAKKNENEILKENSNPIKFYFSTKDNLSIVNLLRNLNINSEPPFILMIEKSNIENKFYNKYVRKDLKLNIDEIEKFVNEYKENKLPLFFVSEDIPSNFTEKIELISQNVTNMETDLDMDLEFNSKLNETKIKMDKILANISSQINNDTKQRFSTDNNTYEDTKANDIKDVKADNKTEIIANNFTNDFLNDKYYNKGENVYKIVGKNFEEFLYDNLNKTVVVFGCSSPMYFCDLIFIRIKLISRIFSKHLDKITFCITDPNKNEYIIKKPNLNSDKEKPEDYHHYIFDIVYPILISFDPIDNNVANNNNYSQKNELLIKKVNSVKNFEKELYSNHIIEFILNRLNIKKEEADLEMDYLLHKDFDRIFGYTTEYDFDDEEIVKIKNQRKIDVLIQNMKSFNDFDEETVKAMFKKDPSLIDKYYNIISEKFDNTKYDPNNPEKSAMDAIAEHGKQEL